MHPYHVDGSVTARVCASRDRPIITCIHIRKDIASERKEARGREIGTCDLLMIGSGERERAAPCDVLTIGGAERERYICDVVMANGGERDMYM